MEQEEDIVVRLREEHRQNEHEFGHSVCNEAADEIERLRFTADAWRKAWEFMALGQERGKAPEMKQEMAENSQ
jgi:hypothetical protein